MAPAVYALCAFTSLACAAMLIRGYRRSRTRLLLPVRQPSPGKDDEYSPFPASSVG